MNTNPQIAKLYNRAAWKRLRVSVLSAQPICAMCQCMPATVVDHIQPHKGDHGLFHAIDNLQGLCKRCHDSDKARIEAGGAIKPPMGVDGWPTSPRGRGGSFVKSDAPNHRPVS